MMRKKTIYAVLMTVLVTSFTGCGHLIADGDSKAGSN